MVDPGVTGSHLYFISGKKRDSVYWQGIWHRKRAFLFCFEDVSGLTDYSNQPPVSEVYCENQAVRVIDAWFVYVSNITV